MTGTRVERIRTAGVFSLDGQDFDVDNNIWLVGDDDDVLVVDAAHDAAAIVEGVGERRVSAVVCTHGHNDHINVAVELAGMLGDPPILLHDDDRMLWDTVYPDRAPDGSLHDGDTLRIGGTTLEVLHTPGHSPGGVCLHDAENQHVFGGDTLFNGGPGATGRSFSDFDTIIESIRTRLLTLPPSTEVHTGHGDDTTIEAEAPHIGEWIARGH